MKTKQQLKDELEAVKRKLDCITSVQAGRFRYQKYLDRLPVSVERLKREAEMLNRENEQIRALDLQAESIKRDLEQLERLDPK